MRVLHERPPLWDKIDAKFHVAGYPILFAWGDRIYNPAGVPVPRELHAHEEIHGARQDAYLQGLPPAERAKYDVEGSVFAWWHTYIESPEFRLMEEIPAHRAEYLSFCKRHGNADTRNKALAHIAGKLGSALYGGLVSVAQARDLILRRV